MDIADIILDQHNEQRKLFSLVQQIDADDHDSLIAVWKRLRVLLEAHAEGEERFFYPSLLKEGSGAADADGPDDETRDTIEDHNKIRDAAAAVDTKEVGSDAWFKAVADADVENSNHMAEEERQALVDFRNSAPLDQRHALGVKFLAFVSAHPTGVEAVDKNAERYIKEHQDA